MTSGVTHGQIPTILTGDSRLDYLLSRDHSAHRGFHFGDKPARFLVRGKPGTGKTTLLAQILYNTLKQHRAIGVLACQEELPEETQELFRSFGWTELPVVGLREVRARRDEMLEKGGLVIVYLSHKELTEDSSPGAGLEWRPSIRRFEDYLSIEFPGLLGVSKERVGLIAIDSLNALINSHHLERDVVDEFLKTPNALGLHSLFTFEDPQTTRLEEFLVDVSFHLDYDESGHRTLQVIKARRHECQPFIHSAEITSSTSADENVAFKVYPNLEMLEPAIATPTPSCATDSSLSLGIPGLDDELERISGHTGIKQYSSTLLFGDPGALKTHVALEFLAEGMLQQPQQPGCLFFFESPSPVDRHPGVEIWDASKLFIDTRKRFEAIRFRVLDQDWKPKYKRVVVRDLDSLLTHHEKEAVPFVEFLCRFFQTQGITPLFIHTTKEEISPFLKLCDNALRFCYLSPSTATLVLSVSVTKLDRIQRRCGFLELILEKASGKQRLEALPGALAEIVELANGELGLGPLTLWYYNETPAFTKFFDNLKPVLDPVIRKGEHSEVAWNPFEPEYRKPQRTPEDVFRGLLSRPGYVVRNSTDVITVDEFLLPRLVEEDRLVDLSEYEPSLGESIRRDFLQPMVDRVASGSTGGVHAVPFYANLSVFAYNHKLVHDHQRKIAELLGVADYVETVLGPNGIRAPTWDEIQRIGTFISDATGGEYVPFDCSYTTKECLSCFVLEYLWSDLVDDNPEIPWRLKPLSREVLEEFVHTVRGSLLRDVPLKRRELNPKAVFVRSWFTLLLEMIEKTKDLAISTFQVSRMPTRKLGQRSVSIRGEFFLGILNGSINPRRGLRIIQELTSEEATVDLILKNAALPARTTIWKASVDRAFPGLSKVYNNAVSRTRILNYPALTNVLHEEFARLLTATTVTPELLVETQRELETAIGTLSSNHR